MLVSRPKVSRVHDAENVASEGPMMVPAGVERGHVQRLRPDAPFVQRQVYRRVADRPRAICHVRPVYCV